MPRVRCAIRFVKVSVTALLLLFVASSVGFAQQAGSGQTVEIDDLRAPTAPAFVLLDVTPASIGRPQNPKALTLNLLSAAAQAEGFPRTYALEVAPYWLTSHPNLTFDQYEDPNIVESIARTVSFSVATAPLMKSAGAERNTAGSRLGIGVRANIAGGQVNPKLKELVAALNETNAEILLALERGQEIGELRARAGQQARQIQAMDGQRVGFLMTVAAGQVWNFPSDDFALRERDRWGAWVTPAYRFRACRAAASECSALFDAIAVARALGAPARNTQWDLGGRLLWQPTKELAISSEFLRRRAQANSKTNENSSRTVAIVEYRIREDLLLFGSFGKDFDDRETRRTLVSIMGLNIGFGRKPLVKTQ